MLRRRFYTTGGAMGMFPEDMHLVRRDEDSGSSDSWNIGQQTGLWPGANLDAPRSYGRQEREKQRDLMARRRAEGRVVEIGDIEDRIRRESCRYNLELFCRTYSPELFYLEMADMHRQIIRENQESILHGGKIALAAPRGYGKTTITLISIIWAVVYGHAHYIVLVCAEKMQARSRLEDLKESFQDQHSLLAADFPEACAPVADLQGASQRASKQLVLWPAISNEPARKEPTGMKWEIDRVRFPKVPNPYNMAKPADCSGTLIVCKGADAAIRGLVKRELRPDLILLDDPQTDESARSPKQTEDRNKIIRKSIEGLVGPGYALTILSLWTVIESGDLADRFTSDQEPDFRSLRFRAMEKMPDSEELVAEYTARLRDAQRLGDVSGRTAHAWYLLNQARVEAGAVVGWKHNYVSSDVGDQAMQEAVELPGHKRDSDDEANAVRSDKAEKRLVEARAASAELLSRAKAAFCLDYKRLAGQDCASCKLGAGREDEDASCCPLRQREISAVQSQLNKRAMDTSEGHANWQAEYQNNPPAKKTRRLVNLETASIYEAQSGFVQREVPEDAAIIVQGRDVGRHEIHTVTMAVSPGRVCRVIDYYKTPVESPQGRAMLDTQEGRAKMRQIESAVSSALSGLARQDKRVGYRRRNSQNSEDQVPITITCIDSRWPMEVVRRHCYEQGGTHVPTMGRGTNEKQKWSIPRDAERANRRPKSAMDRVFLSYDGQCYTKCNSIGMDPTERKYVWCYYAHSDWYKSNVHAGYLLEPGEAGSISLFDGVDDNGEVMSGAMFQKFHETYAQHLTAEHEEQTAPGVTRWVKSQGREANHYLDATYLCLVALSIVEHLYPAIQLREDPEVQVDTSEPLPAAREAPAKPKAWLEKRKPGTAKKKRGSWASRRKRRR